MSEFEKLLAANQEAMRRVDQVIGQRNLVLREWASLKGKVLTAEPAPDSALAVEFEKSRAAVRQADEDLKAASAEVGRLTDALAREHTKQTRSLM
jgi:NifB/MoaA-like Fe-S oxidoreductase